MPLSRKTERKNDIGSSLDIPRNYHTINVFQREKDKYPKISCTVLNLSWKQKQTHRQREQIRGCQEGGRKKERDGLGV